MIFDYIHVEWYDYVDADSKDGVLPPAIGKLQRLIKANVGSIRFVARVEHYSTQHVLGIDDMSFHSSCARSFDYPKAGQVRVKLVFSFFAVSGQKAALSLLNRLKSGEDMHGEATVTNWYGHDVLFEFSIKDGKVHSKLLE